MPPLLHRAAIMSHTKGLHSMCHIYDNILDCLGHTCSEQVLLLNEIWQCAMPANCVSAKSSTLFVL